MTEPLRSQAEALANRPYTLAIMPDETTDGDPIFVLSHPELRGCMAQGATLPEASANLYDARIEYILSLLEDGLPVPAPSAAARTGTFVVETKFDSKDLSEEPDPTSCLEQLPEHGQISKMIVSIVDEYLASDASGDTAIEISVRET